MRDVISVMQLMKEIGDVFPLHMPKPIVNCDVYEDNESCIAMAKGDYSAHEQKNCHKISSL